MFKTYLLTFSAVLFITAETDNKQFQRYYSVAGGVGLALAIKSARELGRNDTIREIENSAD